MMEWSVLLLVWLCGCVGGLMAGMLGIGGGAVFVPIISHFVTLWMPDAPQYSAIVMANSFAVILIIGIIGTLKQRKTGYFFPSITIVTGSAAILSSLLVSALFVATPLYSKQQFTWIFVGMLTLVLIRFTLKAFQRNDPAATTSHEGHQWNKNALLPYIPAGLLSGVIAALSGLGGGIILIPYFTQRMGIPVKAATALSLSVITFSAIPLVLFYLMKDPLLLPEQHAHTGFILWELMLPLVAGASLTVRLGVNISGKLSERWIFILLSLFILMTVIKLIYETIS
jgi:uncharacterized membrane protein YfcA